MGELINDMFSKLKDLIVALEQYQLVKYNFLNNEKIINFIINLEKIREIIFLKYNRKKLKIKYINSKYHLYFINKFIDIQNKFGYLFLKNFEC